MTDQPSAGPSCAWYKITHWNGHCEDTDEKSTHLYMCASDEYITGMMAMAMSEKGDDWHTILRIEKKLTEEKLAELSSRENCGLTDGAYVEISENEYLTSCTIEITFNENRTAMKFVSKSVELLNGFSYARTLLSPPRDVEMKV